MKQYSSKDWSYKSPYTIISGRYVAEMYPIFVFPEREALYQFLFKSLIVRLENQLRDDNSL